MTDDNGQPVKADLGISVFDKAYSNPDDRVNMLAYCYLSSQIRGAVCRPAYYFDEKNVDRMQAMDLLLLTQGGGDTSGNLTERSVMAICFEG